jgi:WhiB family transcriptional regulator, redox-sensing transcriptional regulator
VIQPHSAEFQVDRASPHLALADFAVADQPWMKRALCSQTDPEAFFPEKGGSTHEAKRVCRGCEVRSECLEFALDHEERYGIWGGMSERERRNVTLPDHEQEQTA